MFSEYMHQTSNKLSYVLSWKKSANIWNYVNSISFGFEFHGRHCVIQRLSGWWLTSLWKNLNFETLDLISYRSFCGASMVLLVFSHEDRNAFRLASDQSSATRIHEMSCNAPGSFRAKSNNNWSTRGGSQATTDFTLPDSKLWNGSTCIRRAIELK